MPGLILDYDPQTPSAKCYRNLTGLAVARLNCYTKGLTKLQCILSGQFDKAEFLNGAKGILAQNIHVVDLRQESHWVMDEMPFSWYEFENSANQGKTLEQIELDEDTKQTFFLSEEKFKVYSEAELEQGLSSDSPAPKDIAIYERMVYTERQIVEQNGAHYHRIPVADHCRPTDYWVQQFVTLVKNLKADDVLYMHCKAGHGRTTTFAVMYDMMLNPDVSMLQILHRQAALGGVNLADFSHYTGHKAIRLQAAKERLAFLERFYEYVSCGDIKHFSWMQFLNIRYPNKTLQFSVFPQQPENQPKFSAVYRP